MVRVIYIIINKNSLYSLLIFLQIKTSSVRKTTEPTKNIISHAFKCHLRQCWKLPLCSNGVLEMFHWKSKTFITNYKWTAGLHCARWSIKLQRVSPVGAEAEWSAIQNSLSNGFFYVHMTGWMVHILGGILHWGICFKRYIS